MNKDDIKNTQQAAALKNVSQYKSVKIEAPATVANLVCGFDVLGMALNGPQDIMELSLTDEPGLKIRHTDGYNLPVEPSQNVAGAALLALLQEYDKKIGFELKYLNDQSGKSNDGFGLGAHYCF